MSQGPLCPNLSQKVQKEVSQMANHKLSCAMLSGGLSINLNPLIIPNNVQTCHRFKCSKKFNLNPRQMSRQCTRLPVGLSVLKFIHPFDL